MLAVHERTVHTGSVRERLSEALRLAKKKGVVELVALSKRVEGPPLHGLPLGLGGVAGAFSLRRGAGVAERVSYRGVAARFEAEGGGRFSSAARWSRELFASLLVDDTVPDWAAPRLLGGFAFEASRPINGGFPPILLVLPLQMEISRGGEVWRTAVLQVEPENDLGLLEEQGRRLLSSMELADFPEQRPSLRMVGGEGRISWLRRVEEAREWIRAGRLEKVVLAREVVFRGDSGVSPRLVFDALWKEQGRGLAFAVVDSPGRAFVGSTPEPLVALEGRHVRTCALAGSAPRGVDTAQDRLFGQRLLSSPKERWEHQLVAESIRRRLSSVATLISVLSPKPLRLRKIQHLWTPVEGELNQDLHVLELAERLHPTPAIGGHPTEAALDFLRKTERLERGWYCGAVGWIDGRGFGEFFVGLRSAFLSEGRAHLYAGAGIVAESDPWAEWLETQMKFRTMLSALGFSAGQPGHGGFGEMR